jgi:hypothetical protein
VFGQHPFGPFHALKTNELRALHVSEVLKQAEGRRSKTLAHAQAGLMFAIIKRAALANRHC